MCIFSNSLELERRLRLLGAHPEQLIPAFTRLEHFQSRFRDERYILMDSCQIDTGDLASVLSAVTVAPGTEAICSSCETHEHDSREEQLRLYNLAREHSIRHPLETEAYWKFANNRDPSDNRRMYDVIRGAIGTRRLTLALDNTFGNSFASVFKRGIVAVWTTHFMAFVPGASGVADQERIEWTGRLVEYLTRALPAFRLPEMTSRWIVFTR